MIQDTVSLSSESSPELRRDRSPAAITVDNLLRSRLRISNPRDPAGVANALRRLYPPDDQAVVREASALPLILEPAGQRSVAVSGPSTAEVDRAQADVERELRFLTTSVQLQDISAELEGWGQAIRGHIADGL